MMVQLFLSLGLLSAQPAGAGSPRVDCRKAIPKNESVNGGARHAEMVSNANVLYVQTANSVFTPFAYEYQTYGGEEFIQFFEQRAVVPFSVKNESFNAGVYKAFRMVKGLSFAHGVPYPLNHVARNMQTKRYPCDPKLWPSG